MMDIGNASDGMMVAERFRRKMKITMMTSAIVSISVNFTSSTDARMETERSYEVSIRTGGRDVIFQSGQQFLDAVDDRDRIRSRLLLDRQNDGANAVKPACGLVVLHAVHHSAEFVQANRGAIAVSHHHGAELRSIHALSVGKIVNVWFSP